MPAKASIDHVVVLMLENRSFDHLFGFLGGVEGIQSGKYSNLVEPSSPPSAANPALPVGANAPWAIAKGQGPGHSLDATTAQLCGIKTGPTASNPIRNNGFALSYKNELLHDRIGAVSNDDIAVVMQSFAPERLPALSALAREFVLCDHWYAEVPGPTMPNRLYVHAATSQGYAHNDWKRTFKVRTIYDSLQEAGKSWAVYSSDDNEVAKLSPANQNAQRFIQYEGNFVKDAGAGQLPNYTFIVPRFAASKDAGLVTSMHAPQDVRPGDALVAEVYQAIRSNEAAWGRTLLIVTFDEHGGFYDHVAPPEAVNPDGIDSPAPDDHISFAPTFRFDRLGLRVPTLLISPWLPKGKVVSKPLQHTSILATVKKLFRLPRFLTKRDQAANTFEDVLTGLAAARTDCPVRVSSGEQPAEASLPISHADQPANKPLDSIIESMCEGWHAITRNLRGAEPLPEDRPATHHEAHVFLNTRVRHYLRHQSK